MKMKIKLNYYFISIIFILFLIIINISPKLKLKLLNNKNNIEYFDNNKCPNISENNTNINIDAEINSIIPCPSPTLCPSPELENYVNLSLEIVILNPKFSLYNIIYENGEYINKINKDWDNDFKEQICDKDCKCVNTNPKNKDKNNYNYSICLKKSTSSNDNIYYQCPNTCKECNKCHSNNPIVKLNDTSKQNKNISPDMEFKYKEYKKRIHYQKINCNFIDKKYINPEFKNKNVIYNDFFKNKCNMFLKKPKNNKFMFYEDIILKIDIKYITLNKKNIIIKIDKCLINNNNKKYHIFFQDLNNIYLFIQPDINDIVNCNILRLEVSILFKHNDKKKTFKLKTLVNIFKEKESEKYNEKYYENYLKEKKNMNLDKRKDLVSYYDTKYQDNYLNKNITITNCQLNKDYNVYNPDLYIEPDEYKKEILIDNPETWRERIDISRPWIFTG